nr:biotin/lipoyl-containing protein [Brevundimonas vancanneytii]
MTDILMPALSPTMEEGVLAKWHVKVGDTVAAGDVIAEIETDKATMEVEAVDEGEVLEILVPEGAEGVKVNTPIARLSGDAVAPAPKKTEAPVEAPKAEAPKAEAAPAPAAPKSDDGGRIFASPLARRLAAQAGLDLKTVKGTGPHGRIVKRDVEAAGKGGAQPAAAATDGCIRRRAAQGPVAGADGHSGRQLRPDSTGRHEEGRRPPHG